MQAVCREEVLIACARARAIAAGGRHCVEPPTRRHRANVTKLKPHLGGALRQEQGISTLWSGYSRDGRGKVRVRGLSRVRIAFSLTVQEGAYFAQFGMALEPEDVARGIIFALDQPPHVQIAEMVVLPVNRY